MGSLMSGWDSHVHDHNAKTATFERNRSLTRGEIEAYWRSKKRTEEEHMRSISTSPTETPATTPRSGKEIIFERSHSFPIRDRIGELLLNKECSENLEDNNRSNGWWTRSSLAFLNEPPVIDEAPAYGCRHMKLLYSSPTPMQAVHGIKPDAQAY